MPGWIVENDKEHEAIRRLDQDSDRAAAIVGATFFEARLRKAIEARWISDHSKETEVSRNSLFKPDGPLGGFKPKIDVAYLMGLLTVEARDDARIIAEIRNDFAHKLEFHSFSINSAQTRCINLTLIDKHILDKSEVGDGTVLLVQRVKPQYVSGHATAVLPGALEMKKNPRMRYLLTCQLFLYYLADYVSSDTLL